MLFMNTALPITIRPAYADDALALRRLAVTDSAPAVPEGRLLVAEVEGELWAAFAPQTGEVIADPFRRTAGLVELLRTHAALEARPRRRRGRVPAPRFAAAA
jgi:hypothetical protein